MFILDTIFGGRRRGDASPSKESSTKKAKLAPPTRREPLEGIGANGQTRPAHGLVKAGKKGKTNTPGSPTESQEEYTICPGKRYEGGIGGVETLRTF